jgi:hypothetical protein
MTNFILWLWDTGEISSFLFQQYLFLASKIQYKLEKYQVRFAYLLQSPLKWQYHQIRGFENLKVLEQLHLMFCKRILKVRSTTPNYMVYGEIDRFPLEITIKIRMASFLEKSDIWRQLKVIWNVFHEIISLQGKKCKKFNFFQNQNDTCAHLFTLVMKFHDRQSSERCIQKLISRHCLDKTRDGMVFCVITFVCCIKKLCVQLKVIWNEFLVK